MPEVKEYRGIRGLVAAKVLQDTAEEFLCDTPFPIAGVSEISRTTETSSEPHYYDNVPAVVISSTGADEVSMATSAIEFDVLAKVTGQFYDEATGMFVEGERSPDYYAVGYITEKTDGTEVYVWRLKGQFNIPDSTHGTKNDGTDANGQELVYSGINTNHKFTALSNNTAKAVNLPVSDKHSFTEDTFFATVQTPDTIKTVSA